MMVNKLSLLGTVFVLVIAAMTGCSMSQTTDPATPAPTSTPWLASATAISTTIPNSAGPDMVQPSPGLWRDPVPPEAVETLHTIASADIPQRDLIEVTLRLNDPGQPIPEVVRSEPWGFEIGDTHDFWVEDKEMHNRFQVVARLVYKTAHTYFFVEEGINVNVVKLKRLADRFETQTYPTNRAFFGKEWSPGVDNDAHVIFLLLGSIGVNYQNSMDEYSQLVNEYSNEMEMIYLSADVVESDDDCMLAHEFQHVIQWAVDPGEQTWMNEGFSELACPLNGLKAWYSDIISEAFAEHPDTQLNAWSGDLDQALVQYGASNMFMTYFLDRFGEQLTRALVAHPAKGVEGVDEVLESSNTYIGFEEVFADWVVANFLDDPDVEDGRYGYQELNPPQFEVVAEYEILDLPIERQTSVGQYASDYIALYDEGSFQVEFAGATLVELAPTSAHSGKYVWWGGRGTNSDTMLTREFDLTGLQQASLSFYTWYDIERDYDYAYVEVSEDGECWTILPGQTTTDVDPNGVNFGNGYTGASDGWIQEVVDLTPYAGQQVQIRFEYLTDDGPTHPGIFLDDIEIPELNYNDDAESSSGGWVAHGFTPNTVVIHQEWLVQLIIQRHDRTTVERPQLAPDNTGRWNIDLGPEETAVLVVSGRTRFTTEQAEYWYRITTNDSR